MGKFYQNDRSGPKRDFEQRDFAKRSFDDHGGRREMHKTVCSSCGKNCEVPFKPTGSKPVYCNDCFKKNGGGDSRRFQNRNPRRPNFDRRNESRPQNNEQFEIINRKLDKMLKMLTTTPIKEEKETQEKPKKITIIAKKKTKNRKKKSLVTKK